MTVVNAKGDLVKENWLISDALCNPGSYQGVIVSPTILKDDFPSSDCKDLSRVGVRLTVDDNAEEIAALIPELGLIELVFTHFKDGRPFSTAVTLRRKYNFRGELRASGDFLPDQVIFLIRSGFSSMVVPTQFTVKEFRKSLKAYTTAYQPAHLSHVTVIDELRRSSPGAAAR